jgi:hypothetical protein
MTIVVIIKYASILQVFGRLWMQLEQDVSKSSSMCFMFASGNGKIPLGILLIDCYWISIIIMIFWIIRTSMKYRRMFRQEENETCERRLCLDNYRGTINMHTWRALTTAATAVVAAAAYTTTQHGYKYIIQVEQVVYVHEPFPE